MGLGLTCDESEAEDRTRTRHCLGGVARGVRLQWLVTLQEVGVGLRCLVPFVCLWTVFRCLATVAGRFRRSQACCSSGTWSHPVTTVWPCLPRVPSISVVEWVFPGLPTLSLPTTSGVLAGGSQRRVGACWCCALRTRGPATPSFRPALGTLGALARCLACPREWVWWSCTEARGG